jgi:hypothetical protein
VSTWFGCGYSPAAPPVRWPPSSPSRSTHYAGFAWWHFLLLAAIGFWPAVWAAGVTARATGIEDPGFVVIDEVLGQWIALAGAAPVQLEELPGRLRPLPALRYLEAPARAPVGIAARRTRHQRGRRDGGRVCGACVIPGRMFQSVLNAPSETPDPKPQISRVTPPAAIAGGELQIRGKGLP